MVCDVSWCILCSSTWPVLRRQGHYGSVKRFPFCREAGDGETDRESGIDGIWHFPVRDLSSSRGAGRVDERVAAFGDTLRRGLLCRLSRLHDGALVHQLARRVGECRKGKCDAVHLALVHALLVLLLQVLTPKNNETGRAWVMNITASTTCYRFSESQLPSVQYPEEQFVKFRWSDTSLVLSFGKAVELNWVLLL